VGRKLSNVPTVDDLISHPERIAELPAHVATYMLIQVTSILPFLASKTQSAPSERPQEDRLLVIDEAAEVLRVSKDWLYRHADKLPFTVRNGRSLRFSYNGIQIYIRTRLQQGQGGN
jgi:hypothetical protein